MGVIAELVDTSKVELTDVPSLAELKQKLPKHCFQPKLSTSLYHVAKDLIIVAAFYITLLLAEAYTPSYMLKLFFIPLYWLLQGTMFAALFVLAHDCGHGSFSSNTVINDIVGNILNAFIFVPYYPWKLSHQQHHKNTCNIDKDEIFYPKREKDYQEYSLMPFFGFGLGWFFYVCQGFYPRQSNHFNPFDPLFVKNSFKCIISLACIGAWVSLAVVPYGYKFGLISLTVHYLIPVFGFATWLVVITFLHHHDENLPWYGDEKWTFVKGQLSSVDRHYGWAHDLLHNIGTHQIHHLFTKIPHYHLEEATAAFRKEYPHLVRISQDSILPAYIRRFNIYKNQQWIRDDAKVHVFQADFEKDK